MTDAAREQPVAFDGPAGQLAGMLGLPSVPESHRRGVVLIHGWAGYRIGPHRMLLHTARRLLDAGFATLRFDLRGRGDSYGQADQTDLDGMIEDTLSAADFILRQPRLSGVALLGICSGANVAIGAATLNPEITRLVLWSALPFQPQHQPRQRRRRAWHYLKHYAGKAVQGNTWRRLLRGRVNFRLVAKTIVGDPHPPPGRRNLKDSARDIMRAFAHWPGQALFITGANDPEGIAGREIFMPFCESNHLRAEFHLLPGANHSYYHPPHAREVIERTAAWLTQPPAQNQPPETAHEPTP